MSQDERVPLLTEIIGDDDLTNVMYTHLRQHFDEHNLMALTSLSADIMDVIKKHSPDSCYAYDISMLLRVAGCIIETIYEHASASTVGPSPENVARAVAGYMYVYLAAPEAKEIEQQVLN